MCQTFDLPGRALAALDALYLRQDGPPSEEERADAMSAGQAERRRRRAEAAFLERLAQETRGRLAAERQAGAATGRLAALSCRLAWERRQSMAWRTTL
jgi:hypothetical protein